MDTDFPAAHSMDTEWFAVDQDGHVALFISGENGPVPRSTDEERMNLWDVLRALTGKPSTREEEVAYGDGLDVEEAVRLGMFLYEHCQESDYFLDPYGREETPAQPLHVDQLPPQVRAWFRQVRFEGVCFADAPHVQPLESMGCSVWAGGGYLGSDLKTVRPMRGFEKEYVTHCEELRQEVLATGRLHETLQNVRFEGLTAKLRKQLMAGQQKRREGTDGS
jgi:hypothetical protein